MSIIETLKKKNREFIAKGIIKKINSNQIPNYKLYDLEEDELMYKDKTGMTIIEYIIKNNIEYNYKEIKNNYPFVAYLFCKYDKDPIYYENLEEDDLFMIFEGKTLIENLIGNRNNSDINNLIKKIEKHEQIIDILIRNNKFDKIRFINPKIANKIINTKNNEKYLIDKYADNNYTLIEILKVITDIDKVIEILKRLNKQELLQFIFEKDYLKNYMCIKNNNKKETSPKDIQGPLTEEDELQLAELNCLFKEDSRNNPLLVEKFIDAFKYALFNNREEVRKIIHALIDIKKSNNDNFILTIDNNYSSHCRKYKICMNEQEIYPSVLFHELGHLIHNHFANFKYPKEFLDIIIEINNNPQLITNFEEFEKEYRKIEKEATKYAKLQYEKFKDKFNSDYEERIKTKDLPKEITDIALRQTLTKEAFLQKQKDIFCKEYKEHYIIYNYPQYPQISDILDSLFKGILNSGKKMHGHGVEYYLSLNKRFGEIIADFTTLKCLPNSEENFKKIRKIVGDKFVDFILNYMEKLINNQIHDKKTK